MYPFFTCCSRPATQNECLSLQDGSGECNNYPLIAHIASFGKPVILSTGMNDLDSIQPGVNILEKAGVPYALTHCTSMYPTPYEKVRLGALKSMAQKFPHAVLGLSNDSLGNYTCFASVALGARILEKHFTSTTSQAVYRFQLTHKNWRIWSTVSILPGTPRRKKDILQRNNQLLILPMHVLCPFRILLLVTEFNQRKYLGQTPRNRREWEGLSFRKATWEDSK